MKKCNIDNKNFCCKRENLNYRIPVIQGPTGPTGPTGPVGSGLQIDGSVDTVADLPLNNPFNGESYLVGVSNPKYLYVYYDDIKNWKNEGTIQGPQGAVGPAGPQGIQGEKGDGLQIDGTVETQAELPTEDLFNGMTYLVGTGDNVKIFVYDGINREWVDEGPLRGEKGDKGDGLQIDGSVDTFDDLPTEELFNGMAYLVGRFSPKTLYIYDANKLEWVNEGPIQGQKGDDGVTPNIGANKHWFIDGTDTGIVAEGTKGDDGLTPTIGENGNWFLGELDTTKPSRGEKGDKGEPGEQIFSSYANFYSTTEQVFAGGTNYMPIELAVQGLVNGISIEDNDKFVFTNSGVYQINYNVTITNFTELTTIAFISEDGTAKTASIQSVKTAGTQTSLSFITNIDSTRKWQLALLSDTEITLGSTATNLVNASISIVQIPRQTV